MLKNCKVVCITDDCFYVFLSTYWSTLVESMQWKCVDCPPPKKFRTHSAAGKRYDNNFGDSEGLHMVDYLPSKKTIIGQYYAEIMFKWYDAISQKRRGKLSLSVWLLHDNAPVHKSLDTQPAVCDCGFLQLNHPAYSPDLAPNDSYLFRNLKSHLHGPGLQTMNCQKLLLKCGLKGRTDNSFFKA